MWRNKNNGLEHVQLNLFLIIAFIAPAIGAELPERRLLLKDQKKYTLPSESSGLFLENPADAVIDSQGRLYVLDTGAKCIFVWDEKGNFLTQIGRPGKGPGEFSFEDPVRSEISYNGKDVIVLDDQAGKWHTITNLEFKDVKNKDNNLGRIPYFECLNNGKMVVWEQEYRDSKPHSLVYVTDKEFTSRKILIQYEDTTYRRNSKGGWDYDPGSKKPTIYADYSSRFVVIGDSVTPVVKVYNLDGDLVQKLQVTLVPEDFTENDEQELYTLVKWLRPPHQLIKPQHKRLYNFLLPIQDDDLLLLVSKYERSTGHFLGIIYEANNMRRGVFDCDFGENGYLLSSNNRLVAFYNNEIGEYAIKSVFTEWSRQKK